MATFEQLMRKNLMDAVHAAFPALALDGHGEPNTARVVIAERAFNYDNPRTYVLGDSTDHKQLLTVEVTADVARTAKLELFSAQPMDMDAFIETALAADDPVWTWRGRSVRVSRTLLRTELLGLTEGYQENIYFEFTAPFFTAAGIPTIKDETFFDGWQYGCPTIPEPEDEDEEPES